MKTTSLCALINLFVITIINTIVFIFAIMAKLKYPYLFLTMWSFYANSIYLIAILICDISAYFFNSNKLDSVNNFMRNVYSKYSIPLSYTVTFLYWLLVLLGEQFIKWKAGPMVIFFQVYLHGIISFILLFEVLQRQQNNKQHWSYWDILILSIIILFYSIALMIGKYVQDFNPYQFMQYASWRQLITPLILLEVSAINSYQVHLFFLKLKLNYSGEEKEYEIEINSDIVKNKLLIPKE